MPLTNLVEVELLLMFMPPPAGPTPMRPPPNPPLKVWTLVKEVPGNPGIWVNPAFVASVSNSSKRPACGFMPNPISGPPRRPPKGLIPKSAKGERKGLATAVELL